MSQNKTGSFESLKNKKGGIISMEEYRKILNDNNSSDEQIMQRLNYLEVICRNVIKSEIANYVKRQK